MTQLYEVTSLNIFIIKTKQLVAAASEKEAIKKANEACNFYQKEVIEPIIIPLKVKKAYSESDFHDRCNNKGYF